MAPQPVGAVTYGELVTDPNRFPEVVAIYVYLESRDTYLAACSGTLISQTEVLTAAHCVRGFTKFKVEVGATELGNGRIIPVRDSWYSSRYSEAKFANDVGLLLLTSPAGVSKVASLSPARFAPKASTSYTAVGFGDDQNGDQGPLRAAGLSVQTKAASRYFGRVFNPTTTLAAGRYRRAERVYSGACNGDSGGPLFTKIKGKRYVVGVTSYGAVGCETSKPSVFARVGYYLKEIDRGRGILAAVAATPLAEMTLTTTAIAGSYVNSVRLVASTDPSATIVRACVTVSGVPATFSQVNGGSSSIGYTVTNGCMTTSESSTLDGEIDFSSTVALSKAVVTVHDSLGRTVSRDLGQEAALVPLTLAVTATTSFSWERKYTVATPTSLLLFPLKLCVTVDGIAATSSQVYGDVSKIPYTASSGCFSSSSLYAINGGSLAFQKSNLIGTRAVTVTLTDGLGRSQSVALTIVGCASPYNC